MSKSEYDFKSVYMLYLLACRCKLTLTLSHSSNMSLSLGRWTTHWISCNTRAVTIWMYNGSPSSSELFSLRKQKFRINNIILLLVLSRKIQFYTRESSALPLLLFCYIGGQTLIKPLTWCRIPALQFEFMNKLPEIPERAFAGGQSG